MKAVLSIDNKQIESALLTLFKQDSKLNHDLVKPDQLSDYLKKNTPDVILLLEHLDICASLKKQMSNPPSAAIPIISLLYSSSSSNNLLQENIPSDHFWNVGGDVHALMVLVRSYIPMNKKKILVVDDEEVIHDVLKRALGRERYSFTHAFSGEEALRKLQSSKPDLVISDITMPGMDGFEVCKAIKDNSKTMMIPVMILSAHAGELIIEKGFEAGADEYITKPFLVDELISKVEFLFSEITRKRKEKILIVDDNPVILSVLRNGITQQGFTVFTAPCVEKGLNIVEVEKPDIIVSHIDMPKISGFEFCRLLKSDPKTSSIPFIGLASRDSKGARGLGRRAGVDSYLTKPFSVEKVVVIIERFLAERRGLVEIEKEMMIASITSLAKALDERDNYTRFHSENVSKYAVSIANRLQMKEIEIEEVRLAGLLHDIGKIGIRDAILLKPGKLAPSEYDVIKEHPAKGASILTPIASLKNIIPYIMTHHETYDGTGYPDKLEGQSVPLGGRIIAVCDTFDALTTDRPYRKALPINKALELIKELSGTQLCPLCVEQLVADLKENNGIG